MGTQLTGLKKEDNGARNESAHSALRSGLGGP
jgi:hypothetical protein